jgi:PHD/YefM family antitoxin component YafN of YafNO toxin-antitoxin module
MLAKSKPTFNNEPSYNIIIRHCKRSEAIFTLSGLCYNYDMKQLISNEDFTSIQKAQAGLSKVFEKADKDGKFVRVMRNNQPLGVLVPNRVWEAFLEDLEALSSENYLERIAKSRSAKRTYTSNQVKKILKLDV